MSKWVKRATVKKFQILQNQEESKNLKEAQIILIKSLFQ